MEKRLPSIHDLVKVRGVIKRNKGMVKAVHDDFITVIHLRFPERSEILDIPRKYVEVTAIYIGED